jgi:2-hydroxymuconate-semialdehyde hydrolase
MVENCNAMIGGLRTHYLQQGDGPVFVLLHGQLPGSSAEVEFGRTVDAMARAGFAVFAPDLAGFGETDNPADYAIEVRISHVKAFLAFTGAERYALWGSSMGSYIGALIAREDPRVSHLVMGPASVLPPPAVSPPPPGTPNMAEVVQAYKPSLENARNLLNHVLVDKALVTDELVRLFFEASRGKNEEAEHARRAVGRPRPIYNDLASLKTPTLMLWGADDPVATPERALGLFAGIPNAELHVLHRCGHWPQHDRSERAHHLAADFLRSPR